MVANFRRATFTIHDQPTMLLDYARQQELVNAAKAGTGELLLLRLLLSERKAHKIVSNHPNENDRFEQVWERACSPDSPLVKGVKELRELDTTENPRKVADTIAETDTFISRHAAAMNICEHPSVTLLLFVSCRKNADK